MATPAPSRQGASAADETSALQSSFHRTIDRIENLKIKVRLAKIADKSVPLGDEFLQHDPALAALTDDRRRAMLPKPEVAVMQWGEKVFSPSEVLRYRDLSRNPTQLETKYHGMVHQLATSPRSAAARVLAAGRVDARKQLFTYTQADTYRPPSTFLSSPFSNKPTTQPNRAPTFHPRANTTHPHRHRRTRLELSDIVAEDPADPRPAIDAQGVGWEEMHVMAFLGAEEESGVVERRLCTVRVYGSGLVVFTPGLTDPPTPYRFTLGLDTYEYTFKCASDPKTREETEREWRIFDEFYTQKQTHLSRLLPPTFTPLPAPTQLRHTLTGQITRTTQFPSRDVYITYLLALPIGWAADEDEARGQLLGGTTQVARGVWEKGWRASVGCPLEWVLVRRDKNKDRPKLFITVNSVDSWNRHRVEGYGYLYIPQTTGHHTLTIPTWRPLGTYLTRLREFFIGGSPELEDLEWMCLPDGDKPRVVNKFGSQVATSGTVEVELNVVEQAEVHQAKASARKDGLGHLNKMNIQAITDALARARARVKALQESRMGAGAG
ncbi:ciliary basal body-associated, B9 protein-domain-containing protein [Fimicolochytrium jonesii]|uniref:ciliary basal body-associated, B9 protein-domain-containing protein n=1 Tax=Fimicolochytrium jonesii TaxID=1396493 RepID=UPI0022FDCCC5|nr:ciliary basal body-associated, B9 protein-domain-containing protein [Fimicolochytrium jonesii]KAI8819600.1 ciliary basal body-associated, B9 protein-domain-containing protein [Fimicolochytrium jonesii]